jgi:hypothetical protein
MSAGPSRGDLPVDDTGPMRLVIDLDLGLLPNDPGAEDHTAVGARGRTAFLDVSLGVDASRRGDFNRVPGTPCAWDLRPGSL